ncbi:hypothetical protein cypCar_00030586 [Cyprinus carpio]|nr:hypothetical protein cypCar_00030586 [Cyprinus carpio]
MEDIIIETIVVFGMAFVVFISCCLSKSMRKLHLHMVRRITVMTAQCHSQGSQYSPYPANNLHPVYGLQPIPNGPTLGQQYAPGPPSTYLEAGFGDDCRGYFTRNNEYKPSIDCGFWEHCCGTCDNRFCCFYSDPMLSAFKQNLCTM